ncbi:F-box protein At2g26160-like [Tasmannia lanceolata]|uniref:F-box protein At2g26160-like n=1 Tax=Tasmannia lanceolata TaxID=3420 RepID=UPI00406331EA
MKKEKSMDVEEHKWSKLPMDIMVSILNRLSLEDHICFGEVCMWWKTATEKKPHPSSQFPWVLLSENQNSETRSFFSPYECKVYHLKLPEARGVECCGSSGQWMIMTDRVERYFLLSPFTRSKIRLPCEVCSGRFEFDPCNIKKAMVFPPPTFSNPKTMTECVVVALCHDGGLFSCQIGDERWTSIGKESCEYEDFIFYEGIFYAITVSGELEASNLGAKSIHLRSVLLQLPPKPSFSMGVSNHLSTHLMESCGELLVVLRYSRQGMDWSEWPPFSNFAGRGTFRLFKLDQSVPKWVSVESVCDSILFLGESCSISLKAPGLLGFRGNCICFTHKDAPCWGVDLWMFYLENCKIRQHIPSDPHPSQLYNSLKCTNIWVTTHS